MTNFKDTTEHWVFLRRWASDGGNTATALVELRARVEALEAAHRPDKLDRLIALDRDDNGSLVERVAITLRQLQVDSPWIPRYDSEARAAIREVATWLKQEGIEAWAADRLLEEVNRA